MYTYVHGEGARKKIRPHTYIRAGSLTPIAHTYMAGSEQRNKSSSCSWGANLLGRNGMHGRVHREGLYGTGDGNEAWHTGQRRKWTSYVRNGVLLIGTGLAYCKTGLHGILFISTIDLL